MREPRATTLHQSGRPAGIVNVQRPKECFSWKRLARFGDETFILIKLQASQLPPQRTRSSESAHTRDVKSLRGAAFDHLGVCVARPCGTAVWHSRQRPGFKQRPVGKALCFHEALCTVSQVNSHGPLPLGLSLSLIHGAITQALLGPW